VQAAFRAKACRRLIQGLVFASSVLALCACNAQTNWSGAVGSADYTVFERDVYPVLMRDCAYANCHGAEQRFFQVWGPGRTRLDSDDKVTSIQQQEKIRSFQRAISMLYTDGSRPLAESPLLVKPLEASSGGAAHGGVDRYGRNVYRSAQDPGYQVLVRWATYAALPPGTGTTAAGASAPNLAAGTGAAPVSGAVAPASSVTSGTGASAPGAVIAGTGAVAASMWSAGAGALNNGPAQVLGVGATASAGASAPVANPIGIGAGSVAGNVAITAGAGGGP